MIGAGTSQQEDNVISHFGSLVLQNPLVYAHPPGTSITMLGSSLLQQAPSLPPLAKTQQTNTSTTPLWHSISSTSSSGVPIWLPVAVSLCCCLSLALTACIF